MSLSLSLKLTLSSSLLLLLLLLPLDLEHSSTTASPSRSSRSSRSPLSSTASSSSAQRSSRCARSRSRSTRRPPVADTHPTTTHEQKTASGLYLPSAASQAPPPEGTVLAVGPGAPRKDGSIAPVSLKEGDRVVLPAFGGVPVKVGEEVSGAQGPQSLVRREPRGRPFGRSLRPASAWYSLSERAALTGLCHIRTGVPPLPRLGDPRQAQRVNQNRLRLERREEAEEGGREEGGGRRSSEGWRALARKAGAAARASAGRSVSIQLSFCRATHPGIQPPPRNSSNRGPVCACAERIREADA